MGDEYDKHLKNSYPTQEQLHKVSTLWNFKKQRLG